MLAKSDQTKVADVPLAASTLDQSVEMFTVELKGDKDKGEFAMMWGKTALKARACFTVVGGPYVTVDERYFEGFPTAADPYTNPVPNWANSKYMFVKIRPKAQA